MQADLSGVCFICGCTENDPCIIPGPMRRLIPCSWANEERTLCNNPECLAEAFACPTCGLDVRNHTPLMEAGCLMRDAQFMQDGPSWGPTLITTV